MTTLSTIAVIVSVLVSLLSLFSFLYFRGVEWGKLQQKITGLENNGCGELKNLSRKVNEVNENIRELKVRSDLFWGIIEKNAANLLHSPHTVAYDELLLRLQDNPTPTELEALKSYLESDLDEIETRKNTGRSLAVTLVLSRVIARLKGV